MLTSKGGLASNESNSFQCVNSTSVGTGDARASRAGACEARCQILSTCSSIYLPFVNLPFLQCQLQKFRTFVEVGGAAAFCLPWFHPQPITMQPSPKSWHNRTTFPFFAQVFSLQGFSIHLGSKCASCYKTCEWGIEQRVDFYKQAKAKTTFCVATSSWTGLGSWKGTQWSCRASNAEHRERQRNMAPVCGLHSSMHNAYLAPSKLDSIPSCSLHYHRRSSDMWHLRSHPLVRTGRRIPSAVLWQRRKGSKICLPSTLRWLCRIYRRRRCLRLCWFLALMALRMDEKLLIFIGFATQVFPDLPEHIPNRSK